MPSPHVLEGSATELAADVASGKLSPVELTDATLARIRALDPNLRAFITVAEGEAKRDARAIADRLAGGASPGVLAGLPLAVKDLTATAGIRTTQGSLAFANHVPDADDVSVARAKAAGAVVIGKTNTPEFGFGAVCTNRLCGPTANPFDGSLTSGGSSGGSAVAVATGMAALALGTDFGGSVRTPASFCGVVGFRPTPGRIPAPERRLAWEALSTVGLMARTVGDVALGARAIFGPDPRDPVSASLPAFVPPDLAAETGRGLRIAGSPDFGVASVAREVVASFDDALRRIGEHWPVERAHPDCSDAKAAFETLRAAHIHFALKPLLESRRADLTPSVIWNAERGADVTAERYLEGEAARSRLFREFVRFFDRYDVLVTPAASVLPWPNARGDVLEIDGRPLANIIEYLAITYIVSIAGLPSISIPAGMSADARPFGLQLIARHGADAELLRAARAIERIAGFGYRAPPLPD